MINTLTFLLICSEEEGVTVILSILGTYAFLRKGVVGVIICSVKAKVKLAVIGVLGVIAAALITMIIFLNFKGETWVVVAGLEYSVQAGENEQRIAFFKQFGWEVSEQPLSVEEVVIPQEFNAVYERYNQLQKSQGMDLTKYVGKTVKKVVYEILNYQRQDTIVYGTLLIYDNKVIGGDISSAELNGFMCGFMGESGAVSMVKSAAIINEDAIEEATAQPHGDIQQDAYPID